jgi:hypothetical protein
MTFDAGIWERIREQPRLKANVWVLLWIGADDLLQGDWGW